MTSPPSAPITTKAMTTARMTVSITLPSISHPSPGRGSPCHRRDSVASSENTPHESAKKRHKVCLIAMRSTDRSDGALDISAHRVLEIRAIEPVPDAERHAKTRALLPTWIAANITVLLLTMGAALAVSYGLNSWQALAVGLLMLVATSFMGSFIAFLSRYQ
ncbi:cytosine permease [Streptomyces mirabilis]|uniref:cytosine permease n=1 Tax=Streptomyces mirabilis TaxID=68239 RepID=UPI00364EECD7